MDDSASAAPASSLIIPGLRARMGDWIYYSTFLTFKDVAERVEFAKDIHDSDTLNELIQRQLTDRAGEITDYLLHQEQRFFSSLVVGVYGGHPQWYELEVAGGETLDINDLPEYLEGSIGFLSLRGDETLFALDGQHRVLGIREAIEEKPELETEEVGALFVGAPMDGEGLRRTRRLFSTLNRYAKPVSKKDIIALDEDDVVAIVTRRLVSDYPLFEEKVSLGKTKSISRDDRQHLTSIVALYDALDIVIRDRVRGWDDLKRFRPDDDVIDEYEDAARDYWDAVIERHAPLANLAQSEPGDEVAGEYRHREGGHLLFRPVGFLLHTKVCQMLQRDMEFQLEESLDRLAEAPVQLTDFPWAGLLWDETNQRMLTANENQRVAKYILYIGVGGDVGTLQKTAQDIEAEWAGLLNRDPAEVDLPEFV